MHHPAHPPKLRDCSLKYLEDITLVEEILPDGTRLFPHTGQLPMISKAVDKEFFEALPRHLAITDHRGDSRRKYTLHDLATSFCYLANACRKDDLLLLPVFRRDLVARVAIAQRRDKPEAKGVSHSFHLFAEGAFFPDIYMSGKRIAFASHVFDRFQERVAKLPKVPLALLLYMLFYMRGLVMRVNHRSQSIVFPFPDNAILALPFEEHLGHFFFTTCLTAREISDLQPSDPVRLVDFHHGHKLPENMVYYFDYAGSPDFLMTLWRSHAIASIPVDVYKSVGEQTWYHACKIQRTTAGTTFKEGRQLTFHGNFHSYGADLYSPALPLLPPLDPLPPNHYKPL